MCLVLTSSFYSKMGNAIDTLPGERWLQKSKLEYLCFHAKIEIRILKYEYLSGAPTLVLNVSDNQSQALRTKSAVVLAFSLDPHVL